MEKLANLPLRLAIKNPQQVCHKNWSFSSSDPGNRATVVNFPRETKPSQPSHGAIVATSSRN